MKPEDIINLGIDFAHGKADELVVGTFRYKAANTGRMRELMVRLERVLRAKRERKILSGSLEDIRDKLTGGQDEDRAREIVSHLQISSKDQETAT